MTDGETVCGFMESRPSWPNDRFDGAWWTGLWSTESGWQFYPRSLTLDSLREVQERLLLTNEQWTDYIFALSASTQTHPIGLDDIRGYLSATVEQKVQALAAVIRAQKENA